MPTSSSDMATPPVTIVAPAKSKRTGDYPEVEYRSRPKVLKANSREGKEDKENKLTRLMEYLAKIQGRKFTGYIKVNFSQGSIGRIERFEEILNK